MNIGIVNEKGGVGKTTLAVTLAAGLAGKGYRVVLVDTDPQGHIAQWFGLPKEPNLYRLLIDQADIFSLLRDVAPALWWPTETTGTLTILPGDAQTADADALMVEYHIAADALRRALRPLANRVHYIVFDSNPTITEMVTNVLVASDVILVPVDTRSLSVNSTYDTMHRIEKLQENPHIHLQVIGVIPNKHSRWKRERRDNFKDLERDYGNLLWPPIADLVSWEEAPAYGKSIFAYDPKGRAAREGQALVDRFLAAAEVTHEAP